MSRFTAVNIDCNFDYAYERQRLNSLGIDLVERKATPSSWRARRRR